MPRAEERSHQTVIVIEWKGTFHIVSHWNKGSLVSGPMKQNRRKGGGRLIRFHSPPTPRHLLCECSWQQLTSSPSRTDNKPKGCIMQRDGQLSHLASLLSLSRCFVFRYMRWAMSSMAHNLKNRPRFITVRISKLKETQSTVCNPTSGTHNNKGPKDGRILSIWSFVQQTDHVFSCRLTSHSSQPLLSWCSICVGLSFPLVLTYRQINKSLTETKRQTGCLTTTSCCSYTDLQ